MRRLLLCSALLLSGTDTTFAIGSTGQVVRALDGDTIEVLLNHRPERIRLSGIDCPEKGTHNLRADCFRLEVWLGFMSVRHQLRGLG